MPRKGSRLVEFLLVRLENGKYCNVLYWINESEKVFAIRITRKSSRDYCQEEEALFKEWSLEKGHASDPCNNRQRFLQALKKSKFLIKCDAELWVDCDEQQSKDLLILKFAEPEQEIDFKPFEQIEEMDFEPLEQPQEMESQPLDQIQEMDFIDQIQEMDFKFSVQNGTHYSVIHQMENIEAVVPDITEDEIKFPVNYDPTEELQNACRQIHTVPNVPAIQPEVKSSNSPLYEFDVYTTDAVDGGGVIVKEKVNVNNPVNSSSSYMVVIKPK